VFGDPNVRVSNTAQNNNQEDQATDQELELGIQVSLLVPTEQNK
jgi:hypothetical protein